jgi:Tfp pilus assembly protein PilF
MLTMRHKVKVLLWIWVGIGAACQTLSPNEDAGGKAHAELLETKLTLVMTHLEHNQEQAALQEIRSLLRESPDAYQVLAVAGIVYLFFSRTQTAIEYLEKAYKLHPASDVGLNLSAAYLAGHRTREAKALLQELLLDEKYENRERMYHNLGLAYEEENHFASAEANYQKALTENPTYYLSHYRLGLLYGKNGKKRQAEASFSKAISLCPACYEPVQALATLYIEGNLSKKAIALVAKFLDERNTPIPVKKQAQALLSRARSVPQTQTQDTP